MEKREFEDRIDEVLFARGNPDPHVGRDEGFAAWPRVKVPELDAATRIAVFEEVSIGYTHDQAVVEAKRCLQCDLRLQLGCNPAPPEPVFAFDEAHISEVPEEEGVYRLYDEQRNVLAIQGTANLHQELLNALKDNDNAAWFEYEENKMYSQRESELIQNYLQQHGTMPAGGADDLDDLF